MKLKGKIVGAIMGFCVGGPFGALLGAGAGHIFADSSDEKNDEYLFRMGFFHFLMQSLAKLVKADGIVKQEEINEIEKIFKELGVSSDERNELVRIFRYAKDDNSSLDTVIKNYISKYPRFLNEKKLKIDYFYILARVVLSDNQCSLEEENMLERASIALGISEVFYANFSRKNSSGNSYSSDSGKMSISEAIATLGVNKNSTKEEIKKAYKTKCLELHPDTLYSKGVSQSLINLAKEQMQKVNEAYDILKKI